jgi:hypothetical protein
MRILSRLVWLFMFSMVSLATVLFSVQAWRAHDSKHWPTTDGVVVSFYERPNYQYSVGGTSYTASHVSCNEFFDRYLSIRSSPEYAVRYPLQAKVSVHYYHSNPALAVLETTFDSSILIAIAVLALVTGLCFAGFLFGWRLRPRLPWRFLGF